MTEAVFTKTFELLHVSQAVVNATDVVRDASTTTLALAAFAVVVALVALVVVALNVKGVL